MSKPASTTVLITGAAGFIGAACAQRLLNDNYAVVGLDNLNDYYDVALKRERLRPLLRHDRFRLVEADLADDTALDGLFGKQRFDRVLHLAAQAGVRWCLTHPQAYTHSNLVGFSALIERCARLELPLIYASSSSVYGGNDSAVFRETDRVEQPLNFYGATKRANELMAQAYAHTHGLAAIGLRFFTVYGPAGRPDMAPWIFGERMLRGARIQLHDAGEMERDFTFIDDVVDAVVKLLRLPPQPGQAEVLNVGHGSPVRVRDFLAAIEAATGKSAIIKSVPRLPAEMVRTYADTQQLKATIDWQPQTTLQDGVSATVAWLSQWLRRPS